jgi:ParB family chromosome partitioning protein
MPAALPDPIRMIPLDAIDAGALIRDRTATDDNATQELQSSILTHGLRMPIEVFAFAQPEEGREYGLISGFRRLAAVRYLHGMALDKTRHATIPAFVRTPASIAEALTAMVEENAIRAEVSPWEQAMAAVSARDHAIFPSLEEAVDNLYASFARDKRRRLRSIAHLAEELGGWLTDPETLSLRQLLRLASAVTRGFRDVIRHSLDEASLKDPGSQWRTILPILVEAETSGPAEPKPLIYTARPGRPRRLLYPRQGVSIRRERTRDGWCLHITGHDATGMFMDGVLDEIERWCGPA